MSFRLEKRAQGGLEFLLLLAGVIAVAGALVVVISLSAEGLSSEVGGQIENVKDNVIMPGLVGLALGTKMALTKRTREGGSASDF